MSLLTMAYELYLVLVYIQGEGNDEKFRYSYVVATYQEGGEVDILNEELHVVQSERSVQSIFAIKEVIYGVDQ